MHTDELEELLGVPLGESLPVVDRFLADGLLSSVDNLDEPAQRMLSAGGKRLRPILVMAVAGAGGDLDLTDDVLRCCAAVEYMHVGSLVHDDSIDDALTRRGVPTVNAVEGWKHSILVGDYILGRAGQMAAQVSRDVAIAVADAIVAISIGQALEESTLFDITRTEDSALASIQGKTAALVEVACRLGGLAVGLEPDEIEAVASFGLNFGMAFQIIDDILDWVSTEPLMGKPVQKDMASGVYTLPLLYARDEVPDLRILGADEPPDEAAAITAQVVSALRSGSAITRSLALAHEFVDAAAERLAPLRTKYVGLDNLAELPRWYVHWALSTLVPDDLQESVASGLMTYDATSAPYRRVV